MNDFHMKISQFTVYRIITVMLVFMCRYVCCFVVTTLMGRYPSFAELTVLVMKVNYDIVLCIYLLATVMTLLALLAVSNLLTKS